MVTPPHSQLRSGRRPCSITDKTFIKKIRLASAETVTIMPCSSATPVSLEVTKKSLTTHKNTCDAELIAFDNSSPDEELRRNLKAHVEKLGYIYRYVRWPFSLTGLYNMGTTMTNSKFVVHSTADVTFHEGWLDEIKRMWKLYGHSYESFHPYSKPTKGLTGDSWRDEKAPGEIMYVYAPLCHVNVFHRPHVYHWDEALPWWESDVDYWIWCHYNQKFPGLCLGSRVDTQIGGIMAEAQKNLGESHLDTMCAWSHIRLKWMGYHQYTQQDLDTIFGNS